MNKIKILSIILYSFFISCHSDEDLISEERIKNELIINVNGTNFKSVNEKIGGNENCDKLFINASYYEKDKFDFTIKFDLSKEGELLKVWYEEYKLPMVTSQFKQFYLTPNFNPLKTFKISNFYYDETSRNINFDFEGTLFFEDDINITKTVNGKIKIENFKTIDCAVTKHSLRYHKNNFKLFSNTHSMGKSSDGSQTRDYFTNNGFHLTMKLSQDIWSFSTDTISFDENQILDRIVFKEYVGAIKADQIQNIKQADWKNYETSGKIIIQEKYKEKGMDMVKGSIDVVAKENGEIKYNLKGIEFRTGSF